LFETTLSLLWLLAPAICAAIAWWFWVRNPTATSPGWRSRAFIFGLVSASVNAILFGFWVLWLHFHDYPAPSKVHDFCGNIGVVLCIAAFAVASAGEGDGRAQIFLSISAAVGFFLWIPIGIL